MGVIKVMYPISDSPSDKGRFFLARTVECHSPHSPRREQTQTMPKRSKPGPPYTDIPKEIYVVVTNPWGMNSNPRSRGPDDFKRIAAWAKFALQQAGLSGGRIPTVECVYGMGTVSLSL